MDAFIFDHFGHDGFTGSGPLIVDPDLVTESLADRASSAVRMVLAASRSPHCIALAY